MKEIHVVPRNFEHENQAFRESVVHLQINQVSTSLGYDLATESMC
jgi:hypothetical protein